MESKTAIQQAIEALQTEMQKATEQQSPNIASGFHHSIIILQSFLPTEKEQIEQAYSAGSLNKTENILLGKTKVTAEQYFQHTYGQTNT
jgi:hypothetical protein